MIRLRRAGNFPVRSWRAGRGALWIIATVLILSGGLRLGAGTGAALAREIAGSHEADDATFESCETDADVLALLQALRQREETVLLREREIAERAVALDLARTVFDANMATLKQAEDDLKATLALADTAAEDDLARLTSVYENMKPKEAAPLFEAMAPGFAAGFLGRMRPDAAAAVMAGLKPETAYSISVILAGRNAAAPID